MEQNLLFIRVMKSTASSQARLISLAKKLKLSY
jgi:hypothetical protein